MKRSGRGAATIELVILTPVLIAMLLFVVALGRVVSARQDVEAAARDGARSAANARNAASAAEDGQQEARATLSELGVNCRSLTVSVDTVNFRADGLVAATVACTVDLADLAGLRIAVGRTITATFVAPVDRYRGVS